MIGRGIAALALSLSLTATAHAATLFAGPLNPNLNEERLICSVTNVGTTARNVTIEIYGTVSGVGPGVVDSLGPFALSALDTVTISAATGFPDFPHVCKFTVPSKSVFRAVACVGTITNERTCVPAQ